MLIACSILQQKLPCWLLTVMFTINSSSQRQEYSKLLSSQCRSSCSLCHISLQLH